VEFLERITLHRKKSIPICFDRTMVFMLACEFMHVNRAVLFAQYFVVVMTIPKGATVWCGKTRCGVEACDEMEQSQIQQQARMRP
jgi:hypothetical protein